MGGWAVSRIAWMCACLVVGSVTSGWTQGRRTGKIIGVQGTTQVDRLTATHFEDAVRNMPLYPGDTLRTGPDGRADLLLADNSHAKLGMNSLAQLIPPRGLPLLLLQGQYWGRPRRGMAPRTPVARILSRGTELHVEVAVDGTTTLTVLEGAAQFETDQGWVLVREREQSTARRGQKPTPPIAAVNLPFILQWTNDVQPVVLLLEVRYVSEDPGRLAAARREAEGLPEGAARHQRLGDVLHDRGELQAALAAYEAGRAALGAGAAAGVRAALTMRIGQTRLELGKVPEAEAAFRESLALDGRLTAARAGLVMTLLSRRQNAAAEAEARAATAGEEGSAVAHTVLGLVLIREGERKAAQQELEQALARDPRYAPAYAWQSFLLRAGERLEEAEAAARRAVELTPYSSLARQALSDALFAQGRVREAREEAERAVALNPLSPGAHVSLGRVWVQEGELERALREADEAVALDPELERARFFRGIVLAEQRRLDLAARELEAAVRLDTGYVEAEAFLARVYLEQGRRGEADRVVREALGRAPGFGPARAALGRVYWRAGRLKEAEEQYAAALKLSGESVLYHLELARVYLDGNKLPDALEEGLAAVGRAPRSSEAHAILGLIYDRMENREQATREYREALALSADNALARFGFGLGILKRNTEGTLLESAQAARHDPFTDGLREVVQATVRDPSVFAQQFKPGVTTEIAPVWGNEAQRSLGMTHRDQYLRGKLHDLSFFQQEWLHNYRDGRGERDTLLTPSLSAAPNFRTHLLLDYIYAGGASVLPGSTFSPDRDDQGYNTLSIWSFSSRLELNRSLFAWFHLTHSLVRGGLQNHDALTDAGPVAFAGLRRDQLWAEGRLDYRWGHGHTTSYTLSAGRERSVGQILFQAPSPARIDQFSRPRRVAQTLQDDYRRGSRLTLILGMTQERLMDQIRRASGNAELSTKFVNETSWLPYGQAQYGLTGRDLVRIIAYRRRNLPFDFFLPPSEAFVVGELPAVALGGQTTNQEFDYEHRFSPRVFAKLFLFRSDVDGFEVSPAVQQTLEIPGAEVVGFTVKARVQGIGMRYERQISPFLASYVRYTYTETTDQSADATRGRQLPMNPRSRAVLGLSYFDRAGTKLLTEAAWNSAMFSDPFWSGHEGFDPLAPRPGFPARLVVNLRLARERSVRREWVLRVSNLFNTKTIYWSGFPAPGRIYQVEHRIRF